ncbi:hypothetical protein ARNL5_01326 [Anaerolineae bacterium]|nr:hypothetical protein ARNL5_01326 [Anaerolineae bacterium]
MDDQRVIHCKHGILLWATPPCDKCKEEAETERLRAEVQRLKEENHRLHGQIAHLRTYKGAF